MMKKRSAIALIAISCALLVVPEIAKADVLINGNFDLVGPNGSSVTVFGVGTTASAALGWNQWAGFGFITTDLVPSTDPLGGGNMLHVLTNNGYYPAGGYGNGVGQPFNLTPGVDGGVYPLGGTLNFDIDIVSGEVTGGLVITGDGNFVPGGVFNTPGWQHFTQVYGSDVRDVRFEILTSGAGAEFYLDNATFDPATTVPVTESTTASLLAIGITSLLLLRPSPSGL